LWKQKYTPVEASLLELFRITLIILSEQNLLASGISLHNSSKLWIIELLEGGEDVTWG
jgi:hypothetical protein